MNDEASALRARWDTFGTSKKLHVTGNEFTSNRLIFLFCLWDSSQQSKENDWAGNMH